VRQSLGGGGTKRNDGHAGGPMTGKANFSEAL
jgi:hypothetical protein